MITIITDTNTRMRTTDSSIIHHHHNNNSSLIQQHIGIHLYIRIWSQLIKIKHKR